MSKPTDDFEAAREIANILETFNSSDRLRIMRWALEKLGETPSHSSPSGSPISNAQVPSSDSTQQINTPGPAPDIRSFIQTKNPKNDVQLAATIAYYYAFEAPNQNRKDSINSTDLTEAIRLANKKRPTRPSQVLNNAKTLGLLDSAGDRGQFRINSVGENLVAMVLPGSDTKTVPNKKSKTKKKPSKQRNAK